MAAPFGVALYAFKFVPDKFVPIQVLAASAGSGHTAAVRPARAAAYPTPCSVPPGTPTPLHPSGAPACRCNNEEVTGMADPDGS